MGRAGKVTYNFDPEAWYERELAVLVARRDAGRLDEVGYEAAVADLDRRLDALQARMDRAFDLPRGRETPLEP